MNSLPKVVKRGKKRVGRGYASGKGGHTVGRGVKGQKSRSKLNILFEGVKVKKSLLRRLPLQRGKGKFKASRKPLIVNLDYLDLLEDGARVNIETLSKAGIVKLSDAQSAGVKILGRGKISKKLSIELPISKGASKSIEKAGGKVVSKKKK